SLEKKPSITKIFFSRDKLTASICVLTQSGETDKEEIYKSLKKEGIKYGIKDQKIEAFAQCPTREPVVIAEGNPPILGKDGYLKVLFGAEQKNVPEIETDLIDYRETSTIISVDAGIQLVEVYPPVYGISGVAVTGDTIEPPKPKTITLKAGKGVYLNKEGNKAYAQVNGRPWIKEVGYARIISCDPVYVHNGDVDMKTGNFRFKGDVKISGNVCEAMEVTVSGNIEVQGLVTMAKVIGCGRVVVYGNVINSRLRSGIVFPGAKKLGYMFTDINTELQNLVTAVEQIKTMKVIDFGVVDFGRIVLGLLDSRFKNLRIIIKSIQAFTGNKSATDIPQEILSAVSSLNCFLGLKPLTSEMFEEVLREVSDALDMLKDDGEPTGASIVARSALASVIQSSGSVIITGHGCVNTNITAGGNVTIRGTFKGGEILADGNVEINELGSNLGAPPVVRVSAGSTIKIRRAFEGSVIQVGKRRITLTREMDTFRARLNKEDQLEIF
ncbi:MAG: DUF342 domain-containing protein, partial [Desulfocucumaceae bacterium]